MACEANNGMTSFEWLLAAYAVVAAINVIPRRQSGERGGVPSTAGRV